MTLNLIQKIRKQLKGVKSKVRKRIVKKTKYTPTVLDSKGKVKTKGTKTKVKIKYNKDGTIKKTVSRRGGKRRVVKKKRDSRKTTLNAIRNLRDAKREKRYTTPTRTTVREKTYTTERRRKKYKKEK